MKRAAAVNIKLARCLLGWSGFFALGAAWAQSAAPPAVEAAAGPRYQDRVIAGGSLVPDVSTGDGGTNDMTGLARALQVDGVASALSSSGGGAHSNLNENGLVAKTQWDTVDFGAWSLDASARTGGSGGNLAERGQGGTVTLRERGLPFDGGWQADNGVGDLNGVNINLARNQSRFFLPTATMEGVVTEWRGPSSMQVVGGLGVPGAYGGIVVPNFQTLHGSTATVGAEGSPAAQWTVGGQLIDAHSANLAIGSAIDTTALQTSTTGLATARWQDAGEKLQINFLDGSVAGKGNGTGAWIDGALTRGRTSQSAGLFRIDPNLTWGNQLIVNDAQGGYYRFGFHSRQWMSDIGIDEVRSVSGLNPNITFVTADSRYQVSHDWGVGAVTNMSRAAGGTNWSLEGFVDESNRHGTVRAQAYFARTAERQDTSVTLDQAWEVPVGARFSTSVSVERASAVPLDGVRDDSTLLGLSMVGGGQLINNVGAEGYVRWARAVQGRTAPGVSANVSLTYQIARSWQALATFYDSRVGAWTPPTVVSPLSLPIAAIIPATEQRGAFLTLRYKRAAGLHFAPLGGAPGSGSGRVTGVVYLDANANARFDAGEAGAPNVTVVLDGRFSVQTDAGGRFDFPAVAAGHHVIAVITDNLPLPWMLVNEGRAEFVVTTRDRADLQLAAQRPR